MAGKKKTKYMAKGGKTTKGMARGGKKTKGMAKGGAMKKTTKGMAKGGMKKSKGMARGGMSGRRGMSDRDMRMMARGIRMMSGGGSVKVTAAQKKKLPPRLVEILMEKERGKKKT